MTNDTSPNENEYLAAIAGLPDQTPSPRRERREIHGHAIGDWVSFRLRAWSDQGFASGRVADVNESRGTLLVETADDIVEVDARETTHGGEVLPF